MSEGNLGILSCGAYVPRGRLPRAVLASAHAWFEPSLGKGSGRRSFCNWDEDAITMGVEAARDALSDTGNDEIAHIELASTTLPFADRSNAGLLREALALPAGARVADAGGSMRAASTALIRALKEPASGQQLLVGSDAIDTRPASQQEASHGHAAAAIVVGEGEPLATLLASASVHQDFVDHYRSAGQRFDYTLEARWTRDEGYRTRVAETVAQALDDAGLGSGDIDHVAIAAPPALTRPLARILEARTLAGEDIAGNVGYCGAAQPLLLLTAALQSASSGERVMLVAVGQGVDVLIFEIRRTSADTSVSSLLASGVDEDNYTRYLAMRRLIELEGGIRSERDNRTAQSAAWRKHEEFTGFVGGECTACGTLQFPAARICVQCGAEDTQVHKRLADMRGEVRSFTEDWLAYTPRPPLVFGNVEFENHANVMMEFTDTEPGQLEVGTALRMQFRIKDFDDRRSFRRYFWKPVPLKGMA